MTIRMSDLYFVFLLNKQKTSFVLDLNYTVVFPRLLVPTRITNLTRITEKMPTTKNSVILVVDCIRMKQ